VAYLNQVSTILQIYIKFTSDVEFTLHYYVAITVSKSGFVLKSLNFMILFLLNVFNNPSEFSLLLSPTKKFLLGHYKLRFRLLFFVSVMSCTFYCTKNILKLTSKMEKLIFKNGSRLVKIIIHLFQQASTGLSHPLSLSGHFPSFQYIHTHNLHVDVVSHCSDLYASIYITG